VYVCMYVCIYVCGDTNAVVGESAVGQNVFLRENVILQDNILIICICIYVCIYVCMYEWVSKILL
jgi:hypothetical protein